MRVHLLLEHPVPSYEAWKHAFDGDPLGRQAHGVRRYRVLRAPGAPDRVAVDLEFDGRDAAEAFRAALLRLWETPIARGVMADPVLRVFDEADAGDYEVD